MTCTRMMWTGACLAWPVVCFLLGLWAYEVPAAMALLAVAGGGSLWGLTVYLLSTDRREADGQMTFAVALSVIGGAYGFWAGMLVGAEGVYHWVAILTACALGCLAGILYRTRSAALLRLTQDAERQADSDAMDPAGTMDRVAH